MRSSAVAKAEAAPIVIYRSVNRDGETFAIDPPTLKRLRDEFGTSVHARPRLFIAYEGPSDLAFSGAVAPQVVQLLTGLTEDRLRRVGGVVFRDSLTERDLPRKP